MFDLEWSDGIAYGELRHEDEVQWSRYNFETADVELHRKGFEMFEAECRRCLDEGLVLPACDYVLKCSHLFNVLDARGAVSVAERTAYIARVRRLAYGVAEAYVEMRKAMGFPLLRRS